MSETIAMDVNTAADIQAALTFIIPQASKPSFESSALTGGEPRLYFKTEERVATIHNLRCATPIPSIEREGFELHHYPTAVDDLYNDKAINSEYEAELKALLQLFTAADRVAVFDYTRRSDSPSVVANGNSCRTPASRVHVDYTVASGPKRAAEVLGQTELQKLLTSGGRIMQINVWRPITGPVLRTPLALAAANSIAASDLIATDQLFPNRIGEIYQLTYNPNQRWYWVPEMKRDEIVLIKGWDSLDDGRARFTAHGAFQLPNQSPHAPPRESIEARCYCLFEGYRDKVRFIGTLK